MLREDILKELGNMLKRGIEEKTYLEEEQNAGLGLSSLELVNFFLKIENKFDIVLDYFLDVKTIADVIDLIQDELKNKMEISNEA